MGVRFQRLTIKDAKVIRIGGIGAGGTHGSVLLWQEDNRGIVLASCGTKTIYRAEDGVSGFERAITGVIYDRMRTSGVGMDAANDYAKRRAARFMKRLKELEWL